MITREELVTKYERMVDEQLVKDLAHHIHDGYQDAMDKCCDIDTEFARQAIPQFRHYSIQSRVKAVALSHDGVGVETRYTKNKSEPYAVLTVGDFLITISMVKALGNLPRSSDFRRVNAIANEHLFSQIEAELGLHKDAKHNAILVHVPATKNERPAKMSLVFPNSDYTGSIHTIDLTPLVEFELERTGGVPQETIPPPVPTLRNRLPKKGAM